MARFYPGLAAFVKPGDPDFWGKVAIFDDLIDVARKEEGIREQHYTPDGVRAAVLLVTGDAALADECRSAAILAEWKAKGNR